MDKLADRASHSLDTNIGAVGVGIDFFRFGAIGVCITDPVGRYHGFGSFICFRVANTVCESVCL